jgi:membrane-associated protein
VRQLFLTSKKKLALYLIAGSLLLLGAVLGILMLERYGLKELIAIVGYPGLFAIIFAESGLFFGFFLPGDSLLVTAGLLASQDYFKITFLLFLLPFAAVAGDSVGFWFGRKVGSKIFNQEKSLLFDKKHLDRAHEFYKKHGGKTIIIARFVPIVRTFAPIVAGAADMDYRKFISFNIFGGLFWTLGMLLLGYFLGNVIPNVDKYLLPLIFLIVFLSILPGIVETFKHNRQKIFSLFMERVKKLPFKF